MTAHLPTQQGSLDATSAAAGAADRTAGPGFGRMLAMVGATVAIAAFALMAIPNLFLWTQVANGGIPAETDYLAFAAGGELARKAPERLYDMGAQREVEQELSADAPCCPVFRPFVNPPHVAVAYGALGADGFRTGYVAMAVVNLVLMGGLVVTVHQLARPLPGTLRGLLLAGTVASGPVTAAMLQGGLSVAAALGIALVVLGDRRRSPNLTAAGLLLVSCKPHFVVLPLLWLALRGRWRSIGRFVLMGLATVVATLPLVGIGPWLRYPDAVLHYSDSGSGLEVDARYWWNLLGSLTSLGLDRHAPWLELAGWLVFAGAAGGLLVLVRRRARGDRSQAPLAAVLLVLGVLAVPHANPHDALVVTPALALALLGARDGLVGRLGRAVVVTLVVGWPVATIAALTTNQRGALAHAPVGLMAVLVAVALCAALRRSPADHPASAVA